MFRVVRIVMGTAMLAILATLVALGVAWLGRLVLSDEPKDQYS